MTEDRFPAEFSPSAIEQRYPADARPAEVEPMVGPVAKVVWTWMLVDMADRQLEEFIRQLAVPRMVYHTIVLLVAMDRRR